MIKYLANINQIKALIKATMYVSLLQLLGLSVVRYRKARELFPNFIKKKS